MSLKHINDITKQVKEREAELLKQAEEERKRIEKEAIEREIRQLGGLKAYRDFTLDKFVGTQIKEACKEFPNINLFIYGKSGTGKTHLSIALIRRTKNYIIVKPMNILRQIRACENSLQEEQVIKKFSMPNLLIDDLGVEKDTEFAVQTIYEIIDMRYMNDRKGLIITSNFSLDELTRKFNSDRLTSRITSMCKIIKLEGRDRRIK